MSSMLPKALQTMYRMQFLPVFLLICFNLRMSFAAADPLLMYLERDLKLNLADSGLFAVLPVMVLGVSSTWAARLIGVMRPRLVVLVFLSVAIVGVIWRSYGGMTGLFGGMVLIGVGLGIVGSVILGILKEVFPARSGAIMSGYTAFVCLGTAVGSGASLPLASVLGGWQAGLAFWGIPLLLATILWMVLMRKLKNAGGAMRKPVRARIWPLLRQKKAWSVAIFYLFRVAGGYLLTIWLASLMRKRGMDADGSGMVLAWATVCQIPSSLLFGRIVRLLGGEARLLMVAMPLSVVSCWGLLFGPLEIWAVFSALFGLCIGAIFTLGMGLIVQRAEDEATVVALSGMSQGLGFMVGGLLAWTGNFWMNSPHAEVYVAVLYTLYSLGGLVFGLSAVATGMVHRCADQPSLAKEQAGKEESGLGDS